MSELINCSFMPKGIVHEDRVWFPCDENFIVGTVDAASYDVYEVGDEIFYPLTHLASVKWFSGEQLNALGAWFGAEGMEFPNDMQEIKWFGPRDRPELLLGFSPNGDAFVCSKVVKFPKNPFSEAVCGVTNLGEDYVCLHDVAKLENLDPQNQELFKMVAMAAGNLGVECRAFKQ